MNYTNKLGLAQAFVNAVVDDDYVSGGDVSVTALVGPPRLFYLKKRHQDEISVDVSDRFHSVIGKAYHALMEKYADKNSIVEERLKINISGWCVTGKPDLFTEDKLQDWKFVNVWTIIFDASKPEYVMQLNIYKYMASLHGFKDIKTLSNVYGLSGWSKTKARRDLGYPQSGVVVVEQQVYEEAMVKSYLNQRVSLFQGCEKNRDEELPMCTPQERWHKPDRFALIKKGRKSAIKLCDNMEDAGRLLKEKYKGADDIELRKGEDIRCLGYCEAREFCDYYKSMSIDTLEVSEDE